MTCVETRFRDEAEFLGDMLLDPRVDIGEGADCARDRAGGDFCSCLDEALSVPVELCKMPGQFDAEGGRLRMNSWLRPIQTDFLAHRRGV